MALPGGMTVLYLVALIIDGLGLLLHVIGMAAPDWSVSKLTSEISFGLFEGCVGGTCGEYSNKSSKLEATEAFALIGFFAGAAALFLALLNIILACCGKSHIKIVPMLSTIASFVALICILIAVIIWGAAIHDSDNWDIGFAFALSLVGGILLGLGGVLVYVGAKQLS